MIAVGPGACRSQSPDGSLLRLRFPEFSALPATQCSVQFSPDGSLLVAACGEAPVPLWDAHSGALLHELYDGASRVVSCAFGPDSQVVSCGGFDDEVTTWSTATGESLGVVAIQSSAIWEVGYRPLGDGLVVASRYGGVSAWAADGEPLWSVPVSGGALSVAASPDGSTVAYGSYGGETGLLDAASGQRVAMLLGGSACAGDVAFTPSGDRVIAGKDDGLVRTWDATTFQLLATLDGAHGYVNGVAVDPGERLVASGHHDGRVILWDLASGERLQVLEGHSGAVLRVAFSPDGSRLASVSRDGTVRVWGVPPA